MKYVVFSRAYRLAEAGLRLTQTCEFLTKNSETLQDPFRRMSARISF
jgi:hypothetical protein